MSQQDSDVDGIADVLDCDVIGSSDRLVVGSQLLGTIDPFDEIEPGAGIELGSHIEGDDFLFACTSCALADDSDTWVERIDSDWPFCGYNWSTLEYIVSNGDSICARRVGAAMGTGYDLQLKSFRGDWGACIDADDSSCDVADGETSYLRSTACVPEPGHTVLAVSAVLSLAVLRGRARSRTTE